MDGRWPPKRNPYDGPPDPPPPPPSQGAGGTPGQPPSSLPYQTAETGIAEPVCYGTMRVAGNIVERYAYSFASTAVAQIGDGIPYVIGDIRGNAGNLYICVVAGTTGAGTRPTAQTSGNIDGGVTWDYVKAGYRHFVAIAFCEGQIFGVGKAWQDKQSFAAYTSLPHDMTTAGGIQLALGTPTGDRPGITGGTVFWFPVDSGTAGLRMIYANTAILWIYLNTGSDADLPETQLEIKGVLAGVSNADANPADIAVDLLTHTRRGAGWPSARVDAVSTGAGTAASWKNYCTATGFIVSWLLDQQTSGLEQLKTLLFATNTDAVMTNRLDGLGWMIKFVPLGTDPITANGATFTPNLTPVYAITPDDMQDTMEMETVPDTERYNSIPIQYIDRAADYATRVVDDPDMADVDVRDLVRASTTVVPMVMAPEAAIQLSRIKAQRSLHVGTKYRFSLPWRFFLVEPTDLLTFTEPMIGWAGQPVRVTAVEEDRSSGRIKIEAEDFPANVGAAAFYTPQVGDGFKPQVSTALGALQVLPGQAAVNTVPDASGTRGGGVDNIFPNPTSETPPPDGVDLTTAEWVGRVNLGVGVAPAGAWVRSPGTGAGLTIPYEVPAIPGETYYLEAQVAAAVAGANKGGFVKITALDSASTSLGTASGPEIDATTFGPSSTTFVMPSGTVRVRFSLVNGSDAAAHAYFDTILARRSIDLKLFAVEPWAARRYTSMCSVFVNAAGTAASYANTGEAFGFDRFTAPSLVQVGLEPAKRLRLRLAALPNAQVLTNMKKFAWAHRSQAVATNIGSPSTQLILHGWNLSTGDFDFWPGYDDWSTQGGGVNLVSYQYPYPWGSIDSTNGSIWDVLIALGADVPFAFF